MVLILNQEVPLQPRVLQEYMVLIKTDSTPFKDSTIGTFLKHKALDIYCKWKNGLLVIDQELHLMACGLSFILNLTNTALAMEFLECTKEELEKISKSLIKNEGCKTYKLPELFDQSYDIAVSLIDRENGCDKAISYISKVKTNCAETKKLLEALLEIIKVIDDNAFLLDVNNIARVTEYDFITQIWPPVFKALVRIHRVLRLKIG